MTNLRHRLLILDFDGTMADTASVIVETMSSVIEELNLPTRTSEAIRTTIGIPLEKVPDILFPGKCDGALFAATYRRIFTDTDAVHRAGPFPTVIETLHKLKEMGVIITVASSRNRPSIQEYLRCFKAEETISLILGANDVAKCKPEPDPVLMTLDHFGLQKEDALVVGDMTFDILMGRAAGCKTVGVSYGNGTVAELKAAGADYIIESFDHLAEII